MAKAICGCYRRDEAQDPETFAAALAMVLQDYPASVVHYAADPRTGVITDFPMGLPGVGQIKLYLDGLRKRQDTLARHAALPKLERRRIERPTPQPGDLANVFVPAGTAMYQHMLKRTKGASEREYRYEPGREGIWVSLAWFSDSQRMAAPTFRVPTVEDISAMYQRYPEDLGQGEAA